MNASMPDEHEPNARLRLPLALGAALLAGFCITALVSREPLRAYLTLLAGALPDIGWSISGGWHVRGLMRFGSVIEDFITLSFLGLALAVPIRARQFSLGADGQMFLAALAACVVSLALGGPWYQVLPAATCAAMLPGFAWA